MITQQRRNITVKLVSIMLVMLICNSQNALSQKKNSFMISAQGELALSSKIEWRHRTEFEDSRYEKEYTGQVTRIGFWWFNRIRSNKQIGLLYSPSLLQLDDTLKQKPARFSTTHKLNFHLTKYHTRDSSSWVGFYTRLSTGLNHIIMRDVNAFYSGYTTPHTTDLNGTGFNPK